MTLSQIPFRLILGLFGPILTLVVTILLVVLSRRTTRVSRTIVRVVWTLGLIGIGILSIFYAKTLVKTRVDLHPFLPGGLRLAAIIEFCQAYFLITTVWLPWVFDKLENTGAGILLAIRQLRARKSGFLTVISFLAFLGVGLSSFGLCFTTSIMGGFGNDLKRKILGNNAHVVVDRERGGFSDWRSILTHVRAIRGVDSATPLVQGEVMVTSQTNLSGVILRGINTQTQQGGTARVLSRELIRGDLRYLESPERLLTLRPEERRPVSARERDEASRNPLSRQPGPELEPIHVSNTSDVLPGVIVGRELASNLHLAVGDEVRVVSPFGGMVTPAGVLPKTRLFRVAGVFYSGMYEYDTKYAYVTIPVAQSFFNYEGDKISSIEVRVTDVDTADGIAAAIRPLVTSQQLRVRDWKQLNQNLFRALRLEKLMMFVLLGVAIVVASFAIVATLLLLVIEKGREIAVLKAMGASEAFIARVFVGVGLLIGLVGSVLGVSTAYLVCKLIQELGIPLDPEVYYIDRLPVFISLIDYGYVMLIAVLVCMVATLYPAWAASRLRPVDGLRIG